MYCNRKFDCHVHSDCSPRGNDSIMLLCESAVARGLIGFAVTDCCDCDRFEEMHFSKRLSESNYCYYKAKDVFKNQLKIIKGIELSQPIFDLDKSDSIIEKGDYDIVLASTKKLSDGRVISSIDYSELTNNELEDIVSSYLDSLLKTAKWGNFDVLSQCALPMRYLNILQNPFFSLRNFDDQIEAILKLLVENEKALEINTCGIRGQYNKCLPPISVTRMFHELGGKLVTIGSGAHSADLIGADLSEGISEAYEAGFDKYCYFEKRKPVMIKIK